MADIPKCPICKTAAYMTVGERIRCAGCDNTWTLAGSPTKPVTRGWRQPRIPMGTAHDLGDEYGRKPGTLTAVWVARDVLRANRRS